MTVATHFRSQQLALQAKLLGKRELNQISIATQGLPTDARYVELGSGSGDFLIKCAERFPHARFFGAELVPDFVEHSRTQVQKRGLQDKIEIAQADVTTDVVDRQISEADVVVMRYTLLHIAQRSELVRRLNDVMKDGAIIVGVEAMWEFCRELPDEGLYQEFMDVQLQALAKRPGTIADMARRLPGLFSGSGFENIDMRIALASNQAPDPDLFMRTVVGLASFVHEAAPTLVEAKYAENLGQYIEDNPEKLMTIQTAVVSGVK